MRAKAKACNVLGDLELVYISIQNQHKTGLVQRALNADTFISSDMKGSEKMKFTAFKLAPLVPVLAGAFLYSPANAANLRIIGGEKVSLSQYPYIAGLVGRGDSAEQAFCGASVINSTWVLTAAHCVIDSTANSLDVLTGISTLSKANEGERISAKRIILHPNYNDNSMENDIALIELSSPTTASVVRAATPADSQAFAMGQPVSVSGWGNLSTTGTEYPDVLHAVDLQVSDFSSCSNAYDGLSSLQICATVPGGKKDSCQGDSGGPLVAKTNNGTIQVGVVSFGDACASATHPGVYTKVSEYTEFLKQAGVNNSAPMVDNGTTPDTNTDTNPTFDNEDYFVAESTANPTENVDLYSENEFAIDNEYYDYDALEVAVIEPFFHVAVNDVSWATVEFYNAGEDFISLSNLQLPNGVTVYVESEDCFSMELGPDEACYLDLDWNPANANDLNGELLAEAFNGSNVKAISIPLKGVVVEQVDVGNDIDWPEADYYSEYPDDWNYDNTDVASGDSAIASDMLYTDTLNLIGVFDEADDYELQFDYQLDGVNGCIYIDDERTYELAANENWQQASIFVPAGADVRWEFKSTNRDRGERKVRLDGVKVTDNKMAANNELPVLPGTNMQNFGPISGAGSAGIGGLMALMLLLGGRRVSATRSRTK